MVVKIDKKKCIGCGSCVAICPKVFELGSDGKAKVKNEKGDTKENIQKAANACPVGAITVK
ncbi:MAG: ferredoxin [Candidatus Micrarchaeia archaeon]